MAFCKHCGTPLTEQGFCQNCDPVKEPAAASPTPPVEATENTAPNTAAEQGNSFNGQAPPPPNNANGQVPPRQPNNMGGGYNQSPNQHQGYQYNQNPNQQNQGYNGNQGQNQNQGYNYSQGQQNQGYNDNQNQYYQNQGYNYSQNPNQKQGSSFTDKIKNFIFNTKDETMNFHPQDVAENKSTSLIAYLGFLFFVPIVAKPHSRYARFHSNQGLLLFLFNIAVGIFNRFFRAIIGAIFTTSFHFGSSTNWFGSMLIGIVGFITTAAGLGLMILGIYNAVSGKAKELPLIGRLRIFKDINV